MSFALDEIARCLHFVTRKMMERKYKRKNCMVKRFQMDYFRIDISKIELFLR